MLPAVHGAVGMVATLVSTPYLGAWIDLSPRLRVAIIICVVEITAITGSCTLLAFFYHHRDFIITHQVYCLQRVAILENNIGRVGLSYYFWLLLLVCQLFQASQLELSQLSSRKIGWSFYLARTRTD